MKKLVKIEESIGGILLLLVSLLIIIQVILRYIFSSSIPWIEEAARYLIIYMVVIGSAVAVYNKEHLNIEILDFFLKGRKLEKLYLVQQAMVTIFAGFLTFIGIQLVLRQIEIGQKSPALQLPMSVPMSAIAIGGLLILINGIASIYLISTHKSGGD